MSEFEVEETNEAAAPGAIEINDSGESTEASKAIVKLEDKVSIPVIPKTLNINGVEVNNDKLRVTIDTEVKTMKINGLGDKEGFDKAEAKLKELSKLRTGSERWRSGVVMKPILAFQKSLKAQVDKTGELCTEGETYLESIIKPIKDAIDIAREEEEKRKDELAKTRRESLVKDFGGVFDGDGTINFPHDTSLFILSTSLRTLSDEDYESEITNIKNAWAIEAARLQAIEDEKSAEANKVKALGQSLNAKRTALRIKELTKFEGYELSAPGIYMRAEHEIVTQEDIEGMEDDAWEAMIEGKTEEVNEEEVIAQSAPVEVEKPKPAGPPSFLTDRNPHVSAPVTNESPVETTHTAETVEEVTPADVIESSPITRSLVFSDVKTHYVIPVSKKYEILIYPGVYSDKVTEGRNIVQTIELHGDLLYSFNKLAE